MKILIISGGSSSERKISLISARAVKEALQANGHIVRLFDYAKGLRVLEGIVENYDLVFPVMHGYEGEDGSLYRYLKSHKYRYIGSDPRGAARAFNKLLFKQYCRRHSIPTAAWKKVKKEEDIRVFGFPCVFKGVYGGSSHEVMVLRSERDLNTRPLKKLLASDNPCFVERFVEGIEITAGVLGRESLPVMEIVPPPKAWFDYKNKYSGKSRELPFAPSVHISLQRRVQKLALKIHTDLKLGSFSRLDLIVHKGVAYVLEINTPGGVGFTPHSLFPKAAQAAGLTFKEMVEKIVMKS